MNLQLKSTCRPLTEEAALAAIAAQAALADENGCGLSGDMRRLADSGILQRLTAPGDPARKATLLRRIGRASLSVGRLAEGHMNAVKLIRLYGSRGHQSRHLTAAGKGLIFGVWGADGDPPVEAEQHLDGTVRLTGMKRFTSGLGTVSRAVVSARHPDGILLVVADVSSGRRGETASWDTTGMRATKSGTYDFDGVMAEALGDPGDYLREPHFEGGVWRYAAVHTGGLEALAEEVRRAVCGAGNASEAQLHRVARIAALAHRARLAVEDAARQVEAPGAGPLQVALSLAAREEVEAACLEGIALADRALGTRSFAKGHRAELVRRDLAFFLRQANLDGKLRQVGQALCAAEGPVGEIWGRQ